MNHTRIYVGDVYAAVQQDDLEQLIPAHIEVKEIKLSPLLMPGVNRFAIIETLTAQDAKIVAEALDGQVLYGVRMYAHTEPAERKRRSDHSDGH